MFSDDDVFLYDVAIKLAHIIVHVLMHIIWQYLLMLSDILKIFRKLFCLFNLFFRKSLYCNQSKMVASTNCLCVHVVV